MNNNTFCAKPFGGEEVVTVEEGGRAEEVGVQVGELAVEALSSLTHHHDNHYNNYININY